jgi:hypothetical protein
LGSDIRHGFGAARIRLLRRRVCGCGDVRHDPDDVDDYFDHDFDHHRGADARQELTSQ